MKTFSKLYPIIILVALVIIGFAFPPVGITLLVLAAGAFIFFDIGLRFTPRWGKENPGNNKEVVSTVPLDKKAQEKLKHEKGVNNKGGKKSG